MRMPWQWFDYSVPEAQTPRGRWAKAYSEMMERRCINRLRVGGEIGVGIAGVMKLLDPSYELPDEVLDEIGAMYGISPMRELRSGKEPR